MNETLPLLGPLSPFTVLGIPATLDLAQVKRAWFRALPLHPPHVDPDGFRRLRAAYEALTRRGGLATAFVASPIDAATTLAQWDDRFGARIAQVTEAVRRSESDALAIGRFVDTTSRLGFADALAAFHAIAPGGGTQDSSTP